jgi:hypothetical protein
MVLEDVVSVGRGPSRLTCCAGGYMWGFGLVIAAMISVNSIFAGYEIALASVSTPISPW